MEAPKNKYDAYKEIMDAIADWDNKEITTQELHTKVVDVVNYLERRGMDILRYRDFQGDLLAIHSDLYGG
jgi:hypothetical protein